MLTWKKRWTSDCKEYDKVDRLKGICYFEERYGRQTEGGMLTCGKRW